MKRFASAMGILLRTVIYLTAVWLAAEAIHFRMTGEYILYYRFLLQTAENAMEEIALINQVYNVWQDHWAVGFTAYFVPVCRALAFVMMAFDAVIAACFRNRKHFVFAALDLIAGLAIALIPVIY